MYACSTLSPRILIDRIQKAAKTLAARNVAILNRTLLITLVIHALFLLLRAIFFRRSFTKRSFLLYVLLSAPSLFIQFWFERIGRPQYDQNNGELRKSGEDLEAKGLTEYMWDVVYWTYGCLMLVALAGDWVWWAWVCIDTSDRSKSELILSTGRCTALLGMARIHDLCGCATEHGWSSWCRR